VLYTKIPDSAQNVVTVFDEILSGNIGLVLFVIALMPTVCEEMLFRGMILNAMRAKYRIFAAIAIVAVLFGIYHMSLVKLIPTGLLGIVLCYAAYRADSIYPAMVMHFLNNVLGVLISCYPEKAESVFPILFRETLRFSDGLLFFGIGMILMSIGLLFLKKRGRRE